MNKAILIGRLTRDPELRHTGNNIPVASFSIAINRPFTNQSGERDVDYINIVVWRKQAENVSNYLSQGSLVAVEGRIQTRSYDAQDGTKRYVTEVIADNVQFLESKQQAQARNKANNDYDFKEEEPETTNVENDPFADFGSDIEISDDELPF
ncbi:MAG: single-stranded DNA-binding protein [Bacilli bacterium]|jgi:single-strand DNA-binding protein|nr:single-stranded DNA-binding protein [Bacilli bacterium]